MKTDVSPGRLDVQFPTVHARHLVALAVALLAVVLVVVGTTTPGAGSLLAGLAVGAAGIVAVFALPLVAVRLVVDLLEA
jgi:hypothetical protein